MLEELMKLSPLCQAVLVACVCEWVWEATMRRAMWGYLLSLCLGASRLEKMDTVCIEDDLLASDHTCVCCVEHF